MSLSKDLKALEHGESLVTTQSRAAVYMAAKRAGLTVTTRVAEDGRVEATLTGLTPAAQDTLKARMRDMTPEERLEILRAFEPCCGARKGACICDVATNVTFTEPRDRAPLCLDCCEEPCSCWEFWPKGTSIVEWADDGEAYRKQSKLVGETEGGAPKYLWRTVRVDKEDTERVIEVK